MHALLSAWPVISLLLPALVLVSAIYFVAWGDRRALAQLLALLACFVVGALLMEFFVFMAARMARAGSPPTVPVLGTGTRQLLATMSHPRSLVAPLMPFRIMSTARPATLTAGTALNRSAPSVRTTNPAALGRLQRWTAQR